MFGEHAYGCCEQDENLINSEERQVLIASFQNCTSLSHAIPHDLSLV